MAVGSLWMHRKGLQLLGGVILGCTATAAAAGLGLSELARAGRWRELLGVATVRAEQLPLSPAEALAAAHAARQLGEPAAERAFLESGLDDPVLGPVAAVELAESVLAEAPARSLELVTPLLRRGPTPELRGEAVATAAAAVAAGGTEPERLHELERLASGLPRGQRRQLQVALAAAAADGGRAQLVGLLRESGRDAAALDAARALLRLPDLGGDEKWWAARALHGHALYEAAAPLLEAIVDSPPRATSRWEVAFMRGRCAFRRGRWTEAGEWYRRAAAAAPGSEHAADVEIHLARSLELAGELDAAIEVARSAVVRRSTDDRRLFLVRLRLRADQPELAARGVAALRSRGSRERGELLLALHDLRRHRVESASTRLEDIRRSSWHGPAAVLAATVAAEAGGWSDALAILDEVAPSLDSYWSQRGRCLVAAAPLELRNQWRQRLEDELDGLHGRALGRRLGCWAALESDPEALARLSARVSVAGGLAEPLAAAPEPAGLAGVLWAAGLEGQAVRWNPGGMPSSSAAASLWSATSFARLGVPWRAIRAADAAWRQALPGVPLRAHPPALQRASFPLPQAPLVRAAASARGVPWQLLAAVAREESRWNPEARSEVGARGLLQLMPATAAEVAAALGRPVPAPDELFDPALSLELGAAELGRLLRVFDGRAAVAVAAYNAGEAQAGLWLDQCGSECREERFVATVSFAATRAYTAEVLAAARSYGELYDVAVAAPELWPMPAVTPPSGDEAGDLLPLPGLPQPS